MASKERNQIDKRLKNMERRIDKLYASSPTLRHIMKEYKDYMATVWQKTEPLHRQIASDPDKKQEYIDAVKKLTMNNGEYNGIVKRLVAAIASVNRSALEIVNDEMVDMYVLGYNEVADVCREAGIKVDG